MIGSQSVLGEFPDAPAELCIFPRSGRVPRTFPERADLIDSTIGEDSPFDRSFGYYAHGVGPETAILPDGWRERLVLVSRENTRFVRGWCRVSAIWQSASMLRGWCLEVHDLAIGKYVAGRPKDLPFTEALIRHVMLDRGTLESRRLALATVAPEIRELTEGWAT